MNNQVSPLLVPGSVNLEEGILKLSRDMDFMKVSLACSNNSYVKVLHKIAKKEINTEDFDQIQKAFEMEFSRMFGQSTGVTFATNESIGTPMITIYSREGTMQRFQIQEVHKNADPQTKANS